MCLSFLERRPDRAHVPLPDEPSGTAEVRWFQPYPDRLLSTVAAPEDEPGAAVVTRETIELAFLVAVQHLPPRQRAVLIVRDVLGWSAKQTSSLLDSTVPSANSALQRARETMPPEPGGWVGRDLVVESWVSGGFGSPMFGRFRHGHAGQPPAGGGVLPAASG